MNPSTVKRCLVGAVLAIAATLPGFQQLHTSVEGLKLIADYEGCRLQPYQCDAGGVDRWYWQYVRRGAGEEHHGTAGRREFYHQRFKGGEGAGSLCPGERTAERL